MKRILLVTAAILTSFWFITPVDAQIIFRPPNVNPPDNRTPARTEGGGSRGAFVPQKRLTALIPTETQFGLTVAEYPTFFVYVPPMSGQTGVFTLLDEENNIVYETLLTLPAQPGVVSVSLPKTGTLKPLEIGKAYEWYFGIVVDPEDRSQDILIKGQIQRVDLSSDLVKELETATPQNQPAVYAASGIWHETLTSLAELRRSTPDDATLTEQWQELLKSETVELDAVSQAPLLESLSALDTRTAQPLGAGKPGVQADGFSPPELREPSRTQPAPGSPQPKTEPNQLETGEPGMRENGFSPPELRELGREQPGGIR